jgi:hypothetical protein
MHFRKNTPYGYNPAPRPHVGSPGNQNRTTAVNLNFSEIDAAIYALQKEETTGPPVRPTRRATPSRPGGGDVLCERLGFGEGIRGGRGEAIKAGCIA